MFASQDIILAVDYHETTTTIRHFDGRTGEERVVKIATTRQELHRAASEALRQAEADQTVWWVMESMTGWLRVKQALPRGVKFVPANVLALPREAKARRRKTDRIDTKRLLRECLHRTLPVAYEPSAEVRQLRRLTAYREDLVARRTAVRNWIDRFLAHETWLDRRGLWSQKGLARLRQLATTLSGSDRLVLGGKLDELEQLEAHLAEVEREVRRLAQDSTEARRLDAIYGIAEIGAVSILARIGDVRRFADAEGLIGYAGLAPGVHQSDLNAKALHVGGPGTDAQLRHYLIEASVWARKIPRYAATYERACRKRGPKVGRLVVARLLLRSIYKMLHDDVAFVPTAA